MIKQALLDLRSVVTATLQKASGARWALVSHRCSAICASSAHHVPCVWACASMSVSPSDCVVMSAIVKEPEG